MIIEASSSGCEPLFEAVSRCSSFTRDLAIITKPRAPYFVKRASVARARHPRELIAHQTMCTCFDRLVQKRTGSTFLSKLFFCCCDYTRLPLTRTSPADLGVVSVLKVLTCKPYASVGKALYAQGDLASERERERRVVGKRAECAQGRARVGIPR